MTSDDDLVGKIAPETLFAGFGPLVGGGAFVLLQFLTAVAALLQSNSACLARCFLSWGLRKFLLAIMHPLL